MARLVPKSDIQKSSSLRAKERSQGVSCDWYCLIARHFRLTVGSSDCISAGTTKRSCRFQSSCVAICGGGKGTDGAHPPASGQLPGAGGPTRAPGDDLGRRGGVVDV